MQASMLIDGLKREMKARGITYAQLAKQIDMSEASIKRMFSQKNLTLQRLDEILQATQIAFDEIAVFAGGSTRLVSQLTLAQEKAIVSDPRIFMIAVSMLNMIPLERLIELYRIEMAELIGYLIKLDKIGFIALQPNNKVKLLVSRTFAWLPDGPIQAHFRSMAETDFLAHKFDQPDEIMQLINLMLSKRSIAALSARLKLLAAEFSQIHQDEVKLPLAEKHPISLLIAARPWLPKTFKALRRTALKNDSQRSTM